MDKLQQFHTQVHRYLVSKRILIWGHPQKTSSQNGQFCPPSICFLHFLFKWGLFTKLLIFGVPRPSPLKRRVIWTAPGCHMYQSGWLLHTTPSHVAEKYMACFFEKQQGECWIEASNFCSTYMMLCKNSNNAAGI